jgi:hypothetical protein
MVLLTFTVFVRFSDRLVNGIVLSAYAEATHRGGGHKIFLLLLWDGHASTHSNTM